MNKYCLLVGFLLVSFTACQQNPEAAKVAVETNSVAEANPPPSPAVALAQQQLEAYNRRDIEAFLVPYSDSVSVHSNLKTFGYQGIDKMREGYASWFGSLDTLHCEVVNRIATGNTVIDQEKVMFQRPGEAPQSMEAIAIYKIKNNKIQEVFFVDTEK